MADEILSTDIPVSDEPQFTEPKPKASTFSFFKGNSVVALFIAVGLVIIAAKYEEIFPSSKAEPTLDNGVLQDYSIKTNETDAAVEQPPPPLQTKNELSELGEAKEVRSDQANINEVNVILVGKLTDLVDKTTELTAQVSSLKNEIDDLKRNQKSVDRSLDAGFSNLSEQVNKVLDRDSKSESALLTAIGDLKGYKSDVQAQRVKFDLNVLHVESYGGQLRLICLDKANPQKVQKIFVGDSVGLWVLKDLKEYKATFVHVDGVEHEEVIN